ncbi:MAG: hypothetical protein LBR25_06745 [Erysipelotrichaceae bacterium]|nr:hypothetical protein [Erysipelotrichaceae bacterium]
MDCKKRKSKIRTSLRIVIITAFALLLSIKSPAVVKADAGCGSITVVAPSSVAIGERFDLHVSITLLEETMLLDTYIIIDGSIEFNITKDPNALGVVYVGGAPGTGTSFAAYMNTLPTPNTVTETYVTTPSYVDTPLVLNLALFDLAAGSHTIQVGFSDGSVDYCYLGQLNSAPVDFAVIDATPTTYKVSFDKNIPAAANDGVSAVPGDVVVSPNADFTVLSSYVPTGAPSNADGNYTFAGWSDSQTGTVISKFTLANSDSSFLSFALGNITAWQIYATGDLVSVGDNITLYAIWTPPSPPVASTPAVQSVSTPTTAAFNTIGIYLAPAGLSAIAMLALLKASKKESD